ncbi:MAG: amino acid permease [Bacteroidales bacterium]|nr:amino acid permease [Bacteroidales bacterium]
MATKGAAAPAQGTPKLKKGAAMVSMGTMAVFIVTNIVSMRGLASQAFYGYTSIFYYLFAAVVFLVPYALVCAELASTWTKSGGVFRWCSEALGPKWGWAAMYYDWQMLVIWFPAVLMFGAVTLAYVFWPETFDAKLAKNIIYTLVVVLAVYWLSTFNSFRGMKSANLLSSLGGICGTFIPAGILIILGVIYIATGHVNHITQREFWPDFTNFNNFVLAASIFLFFAGMEMQAVKVPDMPNPSKTFPQAVMISVVAILVIFVFGTLAIGWVMPPKDISLLAALLVAYNDLWGSLGVPWLGNVMAVLLTFGVFGQVSVVMTGPSTGILAVGRAGYLPPKLQKCNKNGIQVPILWVQGIFATILALALVVLPSVQSAYQILSQMSTVIYLIMVLIVYWAFVRLRRTEPNVKRGFRVPGGAFGMWVVTIVGVIGALIALVISFIPPSQISTGSPVVWVLIVLVGSAFFTIVPFWVYAKRKASWRDPNTTFEPFDWEMEGRRPDQVSKWPAGYVPTEEQVRRAMLWEDGAFGPVSLKTVCDVNNPNLTPNPVVAEEVDRDLGLTADEAADAAAAKKQGLKTPQQPAANAAPAQNTAPAQKAAPAQTPPVTPNPDTPAADALAADAKNIASAADREARDAEIVAQDAEKIKAAEEQARKAEADAKEAAEGDAPADPTDPKAGGPTKK